LIRNFTGLLTYRDVTLYGVVRQAYNIVETPTMIVPHAMEWMKENRYDIMARAPAGAHAEQVPAMLRNLLAERFKMRVHWENREMTTYALVVGKGGPKLTIAKTDPPDGKDSGTFSFTFTSPIRLSYKSTSMAVFARSLSHLMDRPVLDGTGLAGYFDIDIEASADSMPAFADMSSLQGMDEAGAPSESIFDAVKTLGLALEPGKGTPVRFLIVDSAQKMPTPN
jgi:uncharacterized protein (TIGR03435 family)